MSGFELHPRLAADTLAVGTLALAEVRLLDDRRFPWLVLVPRRPGLTGLHQLSVADRPVMMEEITAMARLLEAVFTPERINVGALGNLVPQLHVHIVARFSTDAAWPGPVWGFGQAEPYPAEDPRPEAIRQAFAAAVRRAQRG